MECYSCKSNNGEERISPGPTIYAGEHWLVEHAYPCALRGWLVIVLKRHAEALHELDAAEFSELSYLLEKCVRVLREQMRCEKEYAACFAEAEHFNHIHFHVISRPASLPQEVKGTAIFKLLKPTEHEPIAPGDIRELCEQLQPYF